MRTDYLPLRKAHEEYLKNGEWKCLKSPVGAHYWIGNIKELRCKYCGKVQTVDNRSVFQVIRDDRIARKNPKL